MVSATRTAGTVTVRFRTAPNVDVSSMALADADPKTLADAYPWREFRWRAGQKHYSGFLLVEHPWLSRHLRITT